MVSLNYTFPRALLPAWASPVSPGQLSPVSPKLPTPVLGNGHDLGWAGPPGVTGQAFPGKAVWTGPVVHQYPIHSSVFLHIGGVAQGSRPPKFPVYDVIICKTLQPHAPAPTLLTAAISTQWPGLHLAGPTERQGLAGLSYVFSPCP